jgi:hypothetical protein
LQQQRSGRKNRERLFRYIEPFSSCFGFADLRAWIALAICPARQGQQRSLPMIFQVLSWAFALSSGARSFAWARLAGFWDSGLFLPLYGTFA